MEVILLKPVRRLGKIGDLVSVKPGFGRNFLIPQNIALRATEASRLMIAEKKHELEAKNAEAQAVAEALAKTIEGKDFTFIRQAAADGRLFGSVAGKEIATTISASGHDVSYSQVALDKPIKALGVYKVSLTLHTEVSSHIIVNVARSESEAIDGLRDFKEGKKPVVEIEEAALEEVIEADEDSTPAAENDEE